MKKPRDSHLGFRMDKETHDKLFYIAEYEGRTGSGQILYLIRRCITCEYHLEYTLMLML